MEALSNMITKPSNGVVRRCLSAMDRLLTSRSARIHLLEEMSPGNGPEGSHCGLAIELLAVLHRVVLTRDVIQLHLAAISVLQKVLLAANERLTGAVARKCSNLLLCIHSQR